MKPVWLARFVIVASAVFAGAVITPRAHQVENPPYDLLIINERILDGSGSPWFAGSVAVRDGRIASIGRLPGATGQRVIDARGLIVSPGFINLHSHSDYTLLVDGAAQSKIRQGVTTEILGEAASAAPSWDRWLQISTGTSNPTALRATGPRMRNTSRGLNARASRSILLLTSEVARAMGKDPLDALCDLLISEGGSADTVYFGMSEEDVRLAMRQPWVGVSSDGSAVTPKMAFVGKPHPRFYGTFPWILGHYVREQRVLSLAEAIRKMTSFSAQINGLTDRGLLRPGMAADITIFDPNMVTDKATFEIPLQYSEGIEYVIVNGTIVLDKGRHTGAKPGRVLRGRGRL